MHFKYEAETGVHKKGLSWGKTVNCLTNNEMRHFLTVPSANAHVLGLFPC